MIKTLALALLHDVFLAGLFYFVANYISDVYDLPAMPFYKAVSIVFLSLGFIRFSKGSF
jgi:hypothetical protein